MHQYLENLNWRYATKVFDPNHKVSESDLAEIIEVMRLSASSYGLQPWKLFVVENQEIKNQIMENAWNQAQVGENSQLLVFARPLVIDGTFIEHYLESTAQSMGIERSALNSYADMLY